MLIQTIKRLLYILYIIKNGSEYQSKEMLDWLIDSVLYENFRNKDKNTIIIVESFIS